MKREREGSGRVHGGADRKDDIKFSFDGVEETKMRDFAGRL